MSKLYPSVSGLSILMALALALGEWGFFFYGGSGEGPLGLFSPNRLGFNLAWLTLVYLSFQLLSIPLALGTRDRFIGVADGMASLVPLRRSQKLRLPENHNERDPERVPTAVRRRN